MDDCSLKKSGCLALIGIDLCRNDVQNILNFSFFALFTNFLQWTSLQLVFTQSGFSGISPSQQARDLNASYANGLEQGKANSIHNSNLGLTWETSGFLLVEASTKYCFVLDECMSLNFIRDFKPRF